MNLHIKDLSVQYGKKTAVQGFSLAVPDGELVCLLGPSGCGKSTVLNAVAGFVNPTRGQVLFDGRDVAGLKTEKRGIGMVFQNYSLYPHMTVYANIAFPLSVRGQTAREIKAAVLKMSEIMRIGDLLGRKPAELSGGQQQRVAIARALIKKPRLLLLDEPLSNLDARLRLEMRAEIRRIQQDMKITTVFVTHDQEEAMSVADRIVLMKDGGVQQNGQPKELYFAPANVFAAAFLGTPPVNLLKARCESGRMSLCGGRWLIDAPRYEGGRAYILGIRCEDLCLCAAEEADILLDFSSLELLGRECVVRTELGGQELRFLAPATTQFAAGTKLPVRLKRERVHVFDASSQARLGSLR